MANDRPTPPVTKQLVFAACVLVLTGMAVIWLVSHLHTRNALQQQADGLGDTLARQTALLVTELVLANDMISMNVLLNELTRSSPIAQITVFSVDNQVIAIAGNAVSRSAESTARPGGSYLAPVALQDSVAGYVQVNLDQAQLAAAARQNDWLTLAAMALMLLLTLSAMISLTRLRPATPRRGQYEASAESKPDQAREARSSTVLCLHMANYDVLMNNHWDDTSLPLPEHCYQLLDDVAELYNARVDACDGPDMQLSFPWSGSNGEQAFDALCAATLLMALGARLHKQCNAAESLRLHAGLHCAVPGATTVINTDDEAARIAALICDSSPANALLASLSSIDTGNAHQHFECQRFTDLLDDVKGEPVEVMLIRAPSDSTRALLKRQAAQLQALQSA